MSDLHVQNVSAKFIYGRLMKGSRHAHSNTVLGWGVWVGVITAIWAVAFVFGSVIPSMGDFLSLLGAAFDVSPSLSFLDENACEAEIDCTCAVVLWLHLLGGCLLAPLQGRAMERTIPLAYDDCARFHRFDRPVPIRARPLRGCHGAFPLPQKIPVLQRKCSCPPPPPC